MALYDYECVAHGQFEVQQSIKDSPLTECPHCKKEGEAVVQQNGPPKKLIGLSSFILSGGGWASSGYSK